MSVPFLSLTVYVCDSLSSLAIAMYKFTQSMTMYINLPQKKKLLYNLHCI